MRCKAAGRAIQCVGQNSGSAVKLLARKPVRDLTPSVVWLLPFNPHLPATECASTSGRLPLELLLPADPLGCYKVVYEKWPYQYSAHRRVHGDRLCAVGSGINMVLRPQPWGIIFCLQRFRYDEI